METTDLSGMSPEDAREYVLRCATQLHSIKRERAQLRKSFEEWERRARLAQEAGRTELYDEALSQCRAFTEKHEALGVEEAELAHDVAVMKENLRSVNIAGERTVDPDALLRNLESVVGEHHALENEMRSAELDVELEALKRKLADEENQAPGQDEK